MISLSQQNKTQILFFNKSRVDYSTFDTLIPLISDHLNIQGVIFALILNTHFAAVINRASRHNRVRSSSVNSFRNEKGPASSLWMFRFTYLKLQWLPVHSHVEEETQETWQDQKTLPSNDQRTRLQLWRLSSFWSSSVESVPSVALSSFSHLAAYQTF